MTKCGNKAQKLNNFYFSKFGLHAKSQAMSRKTATRWPNQARREFLSGLEIFFLHLKNIFDSLLFLKGGPNAPTCF